MYLNVYIFIIPTGSKFFWDFTDSASDFTFLINTYKKSCLRPFQINDKLKNFKCFISGKGTNTFFLRSLNFSLKQVVNGSLVKLHASPLERGVRPKKNSDFETEN